MLMSEGKVDKMKKDILKLGGSLRYIGKELMEVENYQYVDYYKYENSTKSLISLEMKLYEGSTHIFEVGNFNIVNGKFAGAIGYDIGSSFIEQNSLGLLIGDNIYAPHVYDTLFVDTKTYLMGGLKELEWYLKFLISEDRLINPYILYVNGNKKIVLPMQEKLYYLKQYANEILLLNMILKKLDGHIILDSNGIFNVKSSVLYFEGIGEMDLAMDLRKYERKIELLTYPLMMAEEGIYGLIADNDRNEVKPL